MRRLSRKTFLAASAAASASLGPSPLRAQSSAEIPAPRAALSQALVLSGGGALGAYEAGVIAALVEGGGIRDGEPLRPYDVVCGTSIGALNAYFVATAQYAKLSTLWSTISTQHVVRLKPQYAKVVIQSSGVISRLVEEFSVVQGLRTNVMGILDGDHLRWWLTNYADFRHPVVMPMFWAVTNLTHERPEYFYLMPNRATDGDRKLVEAAARLALGTNVPVREASPELLVDQIRASAAVPAAFDPVALPAPEGGQALYVDGGVTANTPVRLASALALRVDSVLLNPAFEPVKIRNGVQVLAGSFNTMQRRLMEDAMRAAYFESFALQALKELPPSFTAKAARATNVNLEHMQTIRDALYQSALYVIRPDNELPVSIFGFQDGEALSQTYAIGRADGALGFKHFDPVSRTFTDPPVH
jgi:predicted acylesterase/phospholipase RssA